MEEPPLSPERPTAGTVEERQAPAVAVDGRRLRGVIPYGVESRDLGGWREVIEPGALRGARLDGLVATVDHVGLPLGRFPTTLELEDRADGAHWSVEPPESRADVREAVERGDLRAGSWRMVVGREEWRGDVRHVHEIEELRDVAVATNPAYPAASVELRSAEDVDNEAGERRQKEGKMPDENTGAAVEERTEDEQETEERTEERPAEERSTERAEERGNLRVEDRNQTSTERTVEERVTEAIRSVNKGEARDITTASASAIAPPELATFIWDKLRARSIALRAGAPVIPTMREKVTWPQLVSDVGPEWTSELGELSEGAPGLESLSAVPKKLAHLISKISNEVIDDSEPDLIDVLNNHLIAMLGLKFDLGFFEGDPEANEDSIRGLKHVAEIQEVSMGENGAALTNYDPIIEAVGKLRAADVPEPYAVAMHSTVQTELELLKEESESNKQLARPDGLPPFFTSSQLATDEEQGEAEDARSIYVYAPAQVPVVRRSEAQIELDRSRLFHEDASEMRGKLRADVLAPNPQSICRVVGVIPPGE